MLFIRLIHFKELNFGFDNIEFGGNDECSGSPVKNR